MDFSPRNPAQLGDILRGFRRDRKLTQKELGARLGLPQKVISIAESHPERLTAARIFALLGALEVELVLRDREGGHRPGKPEW